MKLFCINKEKIQSFSVVILYPSIGLWGEQTHLAGKKPTAKNAEKSQIFSFTFSFYWNSSGYLNSPESFFRCSYIAKK